ncbi:MAG: RnfABCDGE type electron transport complex subunit B [Gammaproteobacteria bacterium]|nr:RnfABCDGE type electron transport complex subunit B [Gammaproteobacteria bacterium]
MPIQRQTFDLEADEPLARRIADIDAWLPQTQCMRCGYPHCRAYAEAIARGTAATDRCPPGGAATLAGLARLLDRPRLPLNPAYGAHAPRVRAEIDEAACIGCRKCLVVCPVDAIVGARRQMHSVIAVECTGCELCLPPCPVDCIRLIPAATPAQPGRWPDFSDEEVQRARRRCELRLARRARRRMPATAPAHTVGARLDSAGKKAEIRAAVARVRAKRHAQAVRRTEPS